MILWIFKDLNVAGPESYINLNKIFVVVNVKYNLFCTLISNLSNAMKEPTEWPK